MKPHKPTTPRPSKWLLLLLLGLGLTTGMVSGETSSAKTADTAWEEIKAMEAGPQGAPANAREAQAGMVRHWQWHLELLDRFIATYPTDSRRFQAELQQSSLQASLGHLTGNPTLLREARQRAEALEKATGITETQAADAAFQRVSLLFLEARAAPDRSRDTLLNASRNFAGKYPSDIRGARLLAEVATLFDATPTIKRELLEAALRSSGDPETRSRITDDLRQLDLISQRLPLQFSTLHHGRFSLEDYRGRIVVVVFWAADSPHSLWWWRQFLPALREFPSSRVVIATISLDQDRALLDATIKESGLAFPTAWDGKGWESPLARPYGINRLPTIWVFDRAGRLRTGNSALETIGLIRRLLQEQ